jgi:cytochrome b561
MVAAGAAAAVLNLMLYVVPNPTRFFKYLGALVLLASLLWPLSLDTGTAEKAWLVAIHLVVGITVMSLLTGIVGVVTRPHQPDPLPQ